MPPSLPPWRRTIFNTLAGLTRPSTNRTKLFVDPRVKPGGGEQKSVRRNIDLPRIHRWIEPFEISAAADRVGETAASIERGGVARHQQPTPQALQRFVREDRLDQELAEPGTAMVGADEHVGYVGEGRLVGHDAGKADLHAVAIEAETQRMGDRPLHGLARDAARPMRAARQEIVDQRDIEPVLGGIDFEEVPADGAAGNDALGHRTIPCEPEALTKAARWAKPRRLQPTQGLLAHSSSQSAESVVHGRQQMGDRRG